MTLIFSVAFLVLVIVFLSMAVVSVKQGLEYTIEHFGRYTRTLTPGIHLIIPFVERVGKRMNMMETVIEVPSQDVITKDNAMVTVDGVIFYQVLDAPRASYEVNHLTRAIINLTMTNIRTVMGSMDLDELLSQREKINAQLLSVVDDATTPWGVKVTRIEIKDITPPHDLIEAMARQMKAERLKRASILEAEGERQSEILRAEGEKQAAYLAAEARERQAQAEAKATQMVSDAISKGNIQAINYFVAREYIKALETVGSSENNKIIFMPLEASSVIGSIGGITELAKEAFKEKD